MLVGSIGHPRGGPLTNNRGGFSFILDNPWAANPTVPREESGEVNRSIAAISKSTHADSLSLEILECTWDIQEALASGTNDRHGGTSQLRQIS